MPLTRDQQLELRAAYSKTLDAETVMVMRELREMEIAAAAERSR